MEGDQQMMISPGALDMAGVIVTARKEDYERLTADKIKEIFAVCGLDVESIDQIIEKFKKKI